VYSANATRRTYDRNTDKGEVGGSSPPRPTIQITSKHAAILTFPLSENISQKTNLPTICQLYDWPDGIYTQGVKTLRLKTERLGWISRTLPYRVEGPGRQCNTLQDCARTGKSFLASLRGVVQLVRTLPRRRLESQTVTAVLLLALSSIILPHQGVQFSNQKPHSSCLKSFFPLP